MHVGSSMAGWGEKQRKFHQKIKTMRVWVRRLKRILIGWTSRRVWEMAFIRDFDWANIFKLKLFCMGLRGIKRLKRILIRRISGGRIIRIGQSDLAHPVDLVSTFT